ncbi:SseB family protein [Streptomyces sp. HNM0575]|uniref:SseB family protein n=1 Tax=Streptomyces sp. HNM0575 TaxID=2716338 RepID=UPI0019D2E0DC|nr:SseB family protein [Streptomyces sp. HNM0575]
MPGEATASADARTGRREPRELHAEWEVAATVGEFRRRLVLVPLLDGGLMSAESGGLRWIYAFTSREALAEFARGRGDGGEWEFQSLYGARLLDEVVPSLDFWCGVAVDAGSEDGVLLPPVRGIVPERAAVDAAAEAPGGGSGGSHSPDGPDAGPADAAAAHGEGEGNGP